MEITATDVAVVRSDDERIPVDPNDAEFYVRRVANLEVLDQDDGMFTVQGAIDRLYFDNVCIRPIFGPYQWEQGT